MYKELTVLAIKVSATQSILSMLDKNIAIVPANCTAGLQPLDVSSVNKAANECLRRQFQLWYSDKVCQQSKEGGGGEATLLF